MGKRITEPMLRLIAAANWRGILPADARKRTRDALVNHGLARVERRRWRRDRYRLTDWGLSVRDRHAQALTEAQKQDLVDMGCAVAELADLSIDLHHQLRRPSSQSGHPRKACR
jgi:hypothetical protein